MKLGKELTFLVVIGGICSISGTSLAAAGGVPPAVQETVDKYFATISKAKNLKEITACYSAKLKAKKDNSPDFLGGTDASDFILDFIRAQEPSAVKIIDCSQTGDRVVLKLSPTVLPVALKKEAEKGDSVNLTGEMILLQEGGAWKVHRDKWKAVVEGKSGKFTSSFGADGDEPLRKPESGADLLSQPDDIGSGNKQIQEDKDFASVFRRPFMDKLSPSGEAESVTLIMKVLPSGRCERELIRSGKSTGKEAEEVIERLLSAVQPLPPIPSSLVDKRYLWMTFNWKGQSKSISGPYFENVFPKYVLEN